MPLYREGDTSQSERLEISLGSLHRTEDEALFAGTDVVLPVAVERTHAEGRRGAKWGSGRHVCRRRISCCAPCDYNTLPQIMVQDEIKT